MAKATVRAGDTDKSRLVGVDVHGGLGNQLFMYAAGYALARRRGAELRLNTYWFTRTTDRKLALDRFGITWTECWHPRARGVWRAVWRAFGVDRSNPFRHGVVRERSYRFMPELADVPLPAFLMGYFQSWRYFADVEAEIRAIFDPSRFASDATAPVAAAIAAAREPVMVHIRRGDYASNANTLDRFGLLGADYYERSRAAVEERVKAPSYFVFSDDPVVARALLGHWPNATFVAGLTDTEDLLLMTRCKHFIIANSTFSWWSAWLGRTTGGVVVAPDAWVSAKLRPEMPTTDLFPPDWLVV